MVATSQSDLVGRLDAVVEEARNRVKSMQSQEETAYRETQDRFQQFLAIADRIVAMAREKLERLRERLAFEVTPSHTQTERFYARSVTLDVKSELAGVVRLAFRLTHDADVSHILLDYELEIIPVFFRYNPHARLDLPLAEFDEGTVSRWLDDRVVEFANAYLEMHLTKQHQERAMVPDPVAGISFPKYYAASTLEQDGATYYFISDETRREFEKQHGLTA